MTQWEEMLEKTVISRGLEEEGEKAAMSVDETKKAQTNGTRYS